MTTDPGSVPTKALPLLDDEVENEYALAEECRDTRVPYKKYCRRCKVNNTLALLTISLFSLSRREMIAACFIVKFMSYD